MKRNHTRGMRDIPTIQGLRDRSMPDTSEQAVTEWARLEHEKARLERELDMWISNKRKTEERLNQVDDRLAQLQQMLGLSSDERPTEHRARRTSARATRASEGSSSESQGWREVSLEY